MRRPQVGRERGAGCARQDCLVNSRYALSIFMLRGVPAPGTWQLLYTASVEGGWAMTFEEILDQVMTFEEILDQVMTILQRRRRVAYRTLQVQFHLDAYALEALKDELLYVHQVARDEDGRVLVWTGGADTLLSPLPGSTTHASQPTAAL